MTDKKFDKKIFIRLVTISILLNIIWGLIATQIELLYDRDKGFVTGLGYIIAYGTTFFLCLENERRTTFNYLTLVGIFIGIFLASSFIIGPAMTYFDYKFGSNIIALIVSTIFSATLIVIIVSRYFSIRFKALTGIAVFIGASIVTVTLPEILKQPEYFDLKIFQSQSIFYSAWQILTTGLVAIGIGLK